MNGCLNLGPSKIGYHVHLADHSTRVGVLLLAVLQRADESQPAQKSCRRLPHYVDFRFGPSDHIAVNVSWYVVSMCAHECIFVCCIYVRT